MMMYIQVAAGFVILVAAAEALVRGAVVLADKMGISPLVIGMTVVAVGTSAPELVVSTNAVLSGASGLAIGNLVGSNIANVLLILGVTALVYPIVEKPDAMRRDAVMLMGGTIVFAALCWRGELHTVAGIVLIVAFFTFLGLSYWRESQDPELAAEHLEEIEDMGAKPQSIPVALFFVFLGLVGLWYGSEILIEGGVQIARQFGVSEEVIGLTLFAFGTSLPELAASVVAAIRGHSDVAIGNVVGSNLFNILGVGGVIAFIAPIPVSAQLLSFDIWVMLAATALVMPLLLTKMPMPRHIGALFFAAYCAYIWVQTQGVDKVLGL